MSFRSNSATALRGNICAQDYGTLTPSKSFSSVGSRLQRFQSSACVSSRGTVFHIINLYVGLGLLAQAYALQRGGWAALGLMAGCCWFSAYTGKLVVRCYRRLQTEGTAEDGTSWSALANFVWDHRVKWVVFGLAVTEIFGAGCMALLMLWRNLEGILPSVDPTTLQLCTVVALVPALLVGGLSDLAFVSILGVCSKAVTTCLPVVVYATLSPDSSLHHSPHSLLCVTTLPHAFAIIMLSYSAHVALPSIFAAMEHPADFEWATNVAFTFMLALYLLMGTFGYLVWGAEASPLITYDAAVSVGARWQRVFTAAVSALVCWSIYATIVPIITVVAETLHASFVPESRTAPGPAWRLGVLCVAACLCRLLRGQLARVEVLIGVLSTAVTLVIPLAMHLKLFGPAMSRWATVRHTGLLCCSLLCVVLVALPRLLETPDPG